MRLKMTSSKTENGEWVDKISVFYTEKGDEEISGPFNRRIELVLGKSEKYVSRGVVEMADGTVRIFTVRELGRRNLKGRTHLISEPVEQSFGMAVVGLTRMEHSFITEVVE
jgi:DNA replication initiation complex subunit (GINS family)